MTEPLLSVRHLVKRFKSGAGVVHAVEDVNFDIARGETLGLVGESGSGKSTIGRAILRSIDPTEGEVLFEGRDVARMSQREMRPLRARMQMVFQDPYASLNPRLRVRSVIGEALDAHGLARGARREARIGELLELVGLEASHADRFPHEFSGGQRQRIGVARALAVEPDLIVADEPVSALDVSVQAQVLNLLADLQDEFGLTYVFVSHDLSVVRYIADDVMVISKGEAVEQGSREVLFADPQHPYTRQLFAAPPVTDVEAIRARVQRRKAARAVA
mgnify:CR=1 FL=1